MTICGSYARDTLLHALWRAVICVPVAPLSTGAFPAAWENEEKENAPRTLLRILALDVGTIVRIPYAGVGSFQETVNSRARARVTFRRKVRPVIYSSRFSEKPTPDTLRCS